MWYAKNWVQEVDEIIFLEASLEQRDHRCLVRSWKTAPDAICLVGLLSQYINVG